MKLGDFLQDTMQVSKGAVKLNTKGTIEGYRERYTALRHSAGNLFRYQVYLVSPNDRRMVHVKVPSETVNNFCYDVLLELKKDKSVSRFEDCEIKIFSNCPSFVYTYAYVFAHWDPDKNTATKKGKGMLIELFKKKIPEDKMMLVPGSEKRLPNEVTTQKPVVRNPMGLPLFDKSIYYAIFYMMEEVRFDEVFKSHNYISEARLFASIPEFDSLMARRKTAAAKQKTGRAQANRGVQKDFEKQEQTLNARSMKGLQKPMRAKSPQRLPTSTKKPTGMKSASKPRTAGRR